MGEMKKKMLAEQQEIIWKCEKCGQQRSNKKTHKHGQGLA